MFGEQVQLLSRKKMLRLHQASSLEPFLKWPFSKALVGASARDAVLEALPKEL